MGWQKIVRVSVSAVLTLLILCSLVGMILLGVGVQNADKTGTFNLFGHSYHLNKSTDMEPDILKNDLISIEHLDFSDIQVGDYIAFYYTEAETNEEHLLVRRVQAVNGLTYQVADTQGNVLEISAENSRFLGRAASRSATLGKAVTFLQTEDGKMIFLGWTAGIALCLFGLTILFHVIWKLLKAPKGPSDGITGETLSFDEPVTISKRNL